MKRKRIFIGDIKLVINHNRSLIFSDTTTVNNEQVVADYYGYSEKFDKVYKRNATLVELKDNCYLDITTVKSFIDLLKLCYGVPVNKTYLSKLLISTSPSIQNPLFVDRDSLKLCSGDVRSYREEPTPTLKRDLRR